MSEAIVCETDDDGLSLVTFQSEPVNAMTLAFWESLTTVLEKLIKDDNVKGIMFRSGLQKNVFTAGLSIEELHVPATTPERMKKFWFTFSKVLITIYRCPKPTIALVNGACPAGGCGLALCCDARVMTKDSAMGLNEVQIGIAVPHFWSKLMYSVFGPQYTERALLTGKMHKVPELLEMKAVDCVVEHRDALVGAGKKYWQKVYMPLPAEAYQATKEDLRGTLADSWLSGLEMEFEAAKSFLSRPKTIENLGFVRQMLAASGGRKKAPSSSSKM
ncbi:unnamed protein product [Amoebophrya sp. A25]|nr:unnamed protein product [Amoebophrya sp. A25]|eukprot:GSA25T00026082001.1